MCLVDVHGHLDVATVSCSDCNSGIYFYFFYLRSKRGFLHSDVCTVVPTDVVGLASTVFSVEVARTRLFVAVVMCGTSVELVQNMQCTAEDVVRIQAAFVPMYCPSLTCPVVLLTCLLLILPDSPVPHTSR